MILVIGKETEMTGRGETQKIWNLSDGWYYLKDGERTEVTLPTTLQEDPGTVLELYNDTVTDENRDMVLLTWGAPYHLQVQMDGKTIYQYRDYGFKRNLQMARKLDIEKIKKQGIKGIQSIQGAEITDDAETLTIQTIYGEKTCAYKDGMLERCHVCKGKEHQIYDEIIGESKDTKDADRFDEVRRIEAMSPEEKFAFFQSELSKCIRCNACRNVCPACSCRKCVFDSNKFDSSQKANVDSFEEKMFHIIRAFHVAGRCTDCGECSRVCPQGIPLHLFNRKFIKDIDELYGEYQAGEDTDSKGPLTNFTFDDAEPSIVTERG